MTSEGPQVRVQYEETEENTRLNKNYAKLSL